MMIVDYKAASLRTTPSITTAHKVSNRPALELADRAHHFQAMTILQQHYFETIGRSVVVNLPTLMNIFFKGISTLMDPVVRDEVGLDLPTVVGD